ncbi:MAG: GDP-L-fucose synthase [Candidatus Omnitrophica bacterium]|nr:GDP-L-fucose synthase [Candidatus Omnitrophota bacterium]
MKIDSKIYIAGHNGFVGSFLLKLLRRKGYKNLIFRTSGELDLRRQSQVEAFFEKEKPEYVFLLAGRVGGIMANNTYKAEFIYDNITIATNVVHASYKYGVKKLLNFGSSCIYPKFAPQPIKEEYLLTDTLEPTNEPYAVAKIAAIKLCRYYNEQYGTNFISVMPTNLYGPCDNFNLETSHVLPALIRKFRLAALLSQKKYADIIRDLTLFGNKIDSLDISSLINHLAGFGIKSAFRSKAVVELWGSGEPYRDFLYVDDFADACLFIMERYDYSDIGEFVNVGTGKDIKIRDLAEMIKDVVEFKGQIAWDSSKPDGTPRKVLDISKIKSFGWSPTVNVEEGIAITYKWFKEQEAPKLQVNMEEVAA